MKTHTQEKRHPLKGERGQGLVEMMLVLPFLLILVVGLVEAGVALNRQLTVVNAAREGARFGAFGATPGDIHAQTLLATSQMFEFTEQSAVVAVIHATTNGDGSDFEEWIENIYPGDATVPHVTPEEVLAQLNAEGDSAGVRLVVVDVRYDHQSMLGLPFVGALSDQIPIGSWTVMRLPSPYARNPGCCVYPIAVKDTGVNWPEGYEKGTEIEIRIGTGSSQFGWLYWDPDEGGDAVYLEQSLRNGCSTWGGYKNVCDNTDLTLNALDWIGGDSGESVADGVRDAVDDLEPGGRYISIPVWDEFEACNILQGEGRCDDCKPGTEAVHIVGFVTVDITEVSLTSNPKTITTRFIEFNDICK
jgi:hypothetical protein